MAGFGIDFGALKQPDFLGGALKAYDKGRELRRERDRLAALSKYAMDPAGAAEALASMGEIQDANALLTVGENTRKVRARAAAQPYLAEGDYQGAADAAVKNGDVVFADQLNTFTDRGLALAEKKGRIGGQVLWAASQLETPEERRAHIARQRKRLESAGFTPEQIDGYDVTDPFKMRADAGSFLELEKQAGVIKTEKFGDRVVTTRTTPYGVDTLGAAEIPETRAERRQRQQDQRDAYENDRRFKFDREKFDYERGQDQQFGPGVDRVVGGLLQKQAQGGQLTPQEQGVVDQYWRGRGRGNAGPESMGGDYGYGDPEPATPTPSVADRQPGLAPAPRGAGAPPQPRRQPARPAEQQGGGLPPRAAAMLREGETTTFNNGQTWTLRGGRPVRVS